jgi:fimbrial chaperone protein
MLKKLLFVWGALVLALAPVAAEAAQVTPMIVDIAPVGRGAVARVELSNPGTSVFPLEVQVFRGEISEAGELQLTPADADFLVFPAQTIVQPGSQQVFRLQYIGDPEVATSQIYYMQLRQLPVQVAPEQNQVQIVVNFNVLVNVIPDGATPQPAIVSANPATRGAAHGVEVRMTNSGTRYFLASSMTWEITGRTETGEQVTIRRTPPELAREIGVGVVAPDRSRVFFISTDAPLVEGSVQVRLTQ